MKHPRQPESPRLDMVAVVAAIALLVVLRIASPSNPPGPGIGSAGQNEQQHRADEQPKAKSADGLTSPPPAALREDSTGPKERPHEKEGNGHQPRAPLQYVLRDLVVGAVSFLGSQWLHNFGMVVVTCMLAFVARRQTKIMRQQATDLSSELEISRTSADAAKKSADAAEKALEQMRLEQRAWIGPMGEVRFGGLAVGPLKDCMFGVKNTGKTPGTIVKLGVYYGIERLEDRQIRIAIKQAMLHSKESRVQSLVVPDNPFQIPVEGGDAIDQSTFDEIQHAESATIILAVYLKYIDFARKRRTTRFVCIYESKQKKIVAYEKYNKMT